MPPAPPNDPRPRLSRLVPLAGRPGSTGRSLPRVPGPFASPSWPPAVARSSAHGVIQEQPRGWLFPRNDRPRLAAWAAALPPAPWRWVPADRCGWDGPAAGPSGMALVAADGTWVLWGGQPGGGVSLGTGEVVDLEYLHLLLLRQHRSVPPWLGGLSPAPIDAKGWCMPVSGRDRPWGGTVAVPGDRRRPSLGSFAWPSSHCLSSPRAELQAAWRPTHPLIWR